MAEYIERERILTHLEETKEGIKTPAWEWLLDALLKCYKTFPADDVVPVVHGRWIPTYHTYYNRDGACEIADEWHCSKCGIYSTDEWNYCPNCGAKMDGEENG